MAPTQGALFSTLRRLVTDESIARPIRPLVERHAPSFHVGDGSFGTLRVAHVARVVLVVVLLQVAWEVLLGRAVVCALDLALQVGRESLRAVRGHHAARVRLDVGVVLVLVVDPLVRLERLADLQVGRVLVGHQPRLIGLGVPAEIAPERPAIDPVSHRIEHYGLRLADDRAAVAHLLVPLHDGLHRDLVPAVALAHMLPLAPDVGLIGLHDARELLRIILHRLADAVREVPRGFERDAQLAGDVPRREALLRPPDHVEGEQPLAEWQLRVLHDCPTRHGELVLALAAFPQWQATVCVGIVDLLGAAPDADHSIWPTLRGEILDSTYFVRIPFGQLKKAEVFVAVFVILRSHFFLSLRSLFQLGKACSANGSNAGLPKRSV